MDLVAFDRELRALAADDPLARPFVCDGSPLECRAFIVGANPATAVPFWPYWDTRSGFDKERWTGDYEALRIATGKRPRSSTRERIERIIAAASPVKVLETNAFSVPTASIAELDARRRSDAVLRFLIEAIQPVVILAHGADASRALVQVRTPIVGFDVIESKHLRFARYDDAVALGHRLREAAGAAAESRALAPGTVP